MYLCQWRIQGGATLVRAPLWVHILSFLHTNFSKRSCLGSWRPPYEVGAPLREIIDPLLYVIHTYRQQNLGQNMQKGMHTYSLIHSTTPRYFYIFSTDNSPDILQFAPVNVISTADCQDDWGWINDLYICVRDDSGQQGGCFVSMIKYYRNVVLLENRLNFTDTFQWTNIRDKRTWLNKYPLRQWSSCEMKLGKMAICWQPGFIW